MRPALLRELEAKVADLEFYVGNNISFFMEFARHFLLISPEKHIMSREYSQHILSWKSKASSEIILAKNVPNM